jgi:hypothetical protein
VTVDIVWDACGATQVTLATGHEGALTVRSALFLLAYDVAFEKASKPKALASETGQFTFQARRGGKYTFTRDESVRCGAAGDSP